MARPTTAFAAWSQYLAARVAAMGLTMFDVTANLRTAAALGRTLHRFDRRHRQRAADSLAASFPELPPRRIEELTRGSFEHFVQLAVEVMHTPRMIHGDSWPSRIRLGSIAPALELLNAGKPCILVTGHVGNWEVLGTMMAVLGYRMEALARPIDNPLVNDWLLGIREKRGLRVITKWDATERMIGVLDSGGALGFIADQNAGDKGLFVPFFGRLASTYKSIGLLAISRNVPIVCGYARRIGTDYTFELGATDVIRPEDWSRRRDPLYYVTARYMRAIEAMVRLSPEQYLWMHRRWKSRPRHEREGKPMPAGLRRNLEDLPWMTAEQMTRLQQPAA